MDGVPAIVDTCSHVHFFHWHSACLPPMQRGKWIKDLAPDTAVEDAAWRVLTIRCDTVREWLQAVREEEGDPETVHQLRVATRRAGAAMWLFRDSLSAQASKKLKRLLREIRQAAGIIRDGDVLLGRLRHAAKTLDRRDRPAIDFLVGHTVAQRLPGDEVFAAVMKKSLRKFDKRSSKVIASIQSAKSDQKLAELASESLASQLNRLDRSLANDSHELVDLHEVRIIGKRLRYTMEVVADCYPEKFREEVYPLIGAMQELLGDIHDHGVSVQLYTELCERLPQLLRKRSRRYRPALEGLIERHQQSIDAGLPHFDDWKTQWRSRAEELRRMVEPRNEPLAKETASSDEPISEPLADQSPSIADQATTGDAD